MTFSFECFAGSCDVTGYDLMGTHSGVVSASVSLPRQELQNVSAQDPALALLVQGYNDQLSKLKTHELVKFIQGWRHAQGRTPELCSETSSLQTM